MVFGRVLAWLRTSFQIHHRFAWACDPNLFNFRTFFAQMVFCKEPYLCALISLVLFFPVIYWNATHHWASFLFQSSRRLQEHYSFSFHLLIGLLLIFLTPVGVFGGWLLFTKEQTKNLVATKTKHFLQIYTTVPLFFFLYLVCFTK